jgi:hypothetical protein
MVTAQIKSRIENCFPGGIIGNFVVEQNIDHNGVIAPFSFTSLLPPALEIQEQKSHGNVCPARSTLYISADFLGERGSGQRLCKGALVPRGPGRLHLVFSMWATTGLNDEENETAYPLCLACFSTRKHLRVRRRSGQRFHRIQDRRLAAAVVLPTTISAPPQCSSILSSVTLKHG